MHSPEFSLPQMVGTEAAGPRFWTLGLAEGMLSFSGVGRPVGRVCVGGEKPWKQPLFCRATLEETGWASPAAGIDVAQGRASVCQGRI